MSLISCTSSISSGTIATLLGCFDPSVAAPSIDADTSFCFSGLNRFDQPVGSVRCGSE
ncbi:hypothetical protein PR001_g6647 [Phytophthora rubi]|uniref:Uncharacterized protein n=1 Tax=Phytophthora rubi TaxID=129364 RepID=A0A6A3NK60_9STRA|nr:hypothetical protein PR002_g6230 [Phytophthora rubi]KAE9041382.1 hypothetical protein PR001_g6647 [Phytophthora rubi]